MQTNTVTIGKVSQVAGVSKTTISRYLNGKYEHMSEKTRTRIEAVIKELDYRPSPVARGLKSHKSGLIGVIVSDITNPVTAQLIKGIMDCATAEGYQVIAASSDENPVKEREYIQSMTDRQVEGLIMVVADYNQTELLESLAVKGVPIVLADRPINRPVFDTVTTDNYSMTQQAVKTLYSMGYEAVALFSSDLLKSNVRKARHDAFIAASREYVQNPEDLVYVISQGVENGYRQSVDVFLGKSFGKKIAAFASTPMAMLGLLGAAHELGLRIPEDLGVMGFDNFHWTRLISGGITVIDQPFYEVGVESASLLIERIKNELMGEPKYIELKSKLILRKSTSI